MTAAPKLVSDPNYASSGWEARLALGFARRDGRCLLTRRVHSGPLVVQKSLHPEGPDVCQAIVVHPPGGIAGGDRLAIAIDVAAGAHAQVTTPGAAKWYRSAGADATQTVDARVAAGATLEWLPQEAIVYDGALAGQATSIDLAGDAIFMGWDVVCLGRSAAGERFERGRFAQRVELVRDGALIWSERAVIAGGDAIAASAVGLGGRPVFGTFVVAAPVIGDDLLAACRNAAATALDGTECAVTRLDGVLVARCRGRSAPAARRAFAALWSVVRPALCGRAAVAPRIWST
jgi:urease accessory protein